MPFLTEPEPERGANLPVLPGISRIVANNPGPMTYFGTNTYLIDTAGRARRARSRARRTIPNMSRRSCATPAARSR